MAYNKDKCIAWIDTELTGLDIERDTILEVACIITDEELKVISEEFNVAINQSDAILTSMNEWCIHHHNMTGLISDCQSSKLTLKEAEQMLLDFLKKYISKGTCPLAGNTIYMDRIFLMKHMPSVNDYLHYRIIDVSSLKELVRRWNPVIYNSTPKKECVHRALPDIKESIQELKYYKENIFLSGVP
ncbi:probable oligoribonuclease [Hylaeus volcanicus]|uniref:probable oligoribonuclease n=1 Tax=Hylaeus volcanicus TaxID=313075 RepID=UPI0023B829F4|nr:probable oligoribonuclease [Hylaeus volcanicus]